MKPNTLRVGAVLAVVSIVIQSLADLLHGGTDPANLQVVLPEYAANLNWSAVHLAQFIGFLMMIGSIVILLDSIKADSGTPFALLGMVTAIVAASVYAANQAVDGVAIQYVADAYAHAAPADQASALQIAEAVRHIEQGLSSLATLNLSFTLLLSGVAILASHLFTRWLGWSALVVGGGYLVSSLFLNYLGFSQHVYSFWIGVLLLVWLFFMASVLWRKSSHLMASESSPKN